MKTVQVVAGALIAVASLGCGATVSLGGPSPSACGGASTGPGDMGGFGGGEDAYLPVSPGYVPPAACAAPHGPLDLSSSDGDTAHFLVGSWLACKNTEFLYDFVGWQLNADSTWSGLHLENGVIVEEHGDNQGTDWEVTGSSLILHVSSGGIGGPVWWVGEPPRFMVDFDNGGGDTQFVRCP